MKTTLLTILLLIFCVLSYSSEKVHFINLEKEKVKLRNPGFQLIAVINATGKTTEIGFVEKGLSYKDVTAHFTRDIAEELNDFIHRNLQTSVDDDSLYIRVNKLELSESYNGVNETGIAQVGLTFIYKKDGHYFEKFTTTEQSKIVIMAGVTNKQAGNISAAIGGCFTSFYERTMEQKLSTIEINESALYLAPSNEKEMHEAWLNADRSKKGIYNTYIDFKDNTPDVSQNFEIAYKIKSSGDESVEIKYAKINDQKTRGKSKDIWGFTDGKLPFISAGNKFLPLLKDEESYYAEIKYQDPNTAMAAGIAGGLIGSGIAYAAAPIKKIRLDYYSGTLNYTGQSQKVIDQKNESYNSIKFFSSAFNAATSRLKVYINDTLYCTLKKESWYQYPNCKAGDTLSVRLEAVNGLSESEEIIIRKEKQDIYLCIEKKKKAPVVNRVQSNSLPEIQSLMTPDNRIYTQE